MKGTRTKTSGRRKNKKYRAGRKFYSNLLILLVAAAALYAAASAFENKIDTNTFYKGIYIDDVAMAGLTKEQALKKLEPGQTQKLDQVNIRLRFEDQEWVLDRNAIALTSNISQVIEQGYNTGRSGNLLSRIQKITSLKNRPVKLYSEISYHTKGLDTGLDEIKNALNIEPVDASYDFRPDNKVKFVVKEEKAGRALDTESILKEIQAGLSQGKLDFTVALQFQEVLPKVHVADLAGIPEKLITFGTDLSKSAADRTHNVVLAVSQFNGLVVQPGEILSFNKVVGERTAEKGYRSAPMIVADKSMKDAIGGGVSQASSTLYNAAIRSGMDVVEFQRHSFPVAYLNKGLDTTVNLPTPVIDLKVKNIKDSPIYIRTFYANQKVYIEVYGQPLPNGRTIRIRTDEYETVPAPETEIRRDETGRYVTYEDEKHVHVTSRQGYKVKVYREILEGDKVVDNEMLDDHYYKPIAGITYVGVKKRPVINAEDISGEKEEDKPETSNPPKPDTGSPEGGAAGDEGH